MALVTHLTLVENLRSILQIGSLYSTNELSRRGIRPRSIAFDSIQERRSVRTIVAPPGGVVHDYIPFFFTPRTSMLYTVMNGNVDGVRRSPEDFAFIETDTQSLTAFGIPYVIASGHAIRTETAFYTGARGLEYVDWDAVRTELYDCTDAQKHARQAECLVYESLDVNVFSRIITKNDHVRDDVRSLCKDLGRDCRVWSDGRFYFS